MSKDSVRIARLPLDNPPECGREGKMFLEVTVDYEKGGVSYFTGNSYPRGYYLHLTPVTIHDGFKSMLIGGGLSGIKGLIEGAARFNQRKFDQHATTAIMDTDLYRELLANVQGKGAILSQEPAQAFSTEALAAV